MAHAGQKLKGDSWVLALSEDSGTTWLQVICEKGTTLKLSRDEQNADSKCGNDKAPGDQKDQSISTEILIIQGANVLSTEASYLKLRTWHDAGTTLYWRLGPAATLTTGQLRETGQGWIKSLDAKANHGENISSSIEMVAYPDSTTLVVGV